jgi:hypothetical protein
VTSKIIAGFLFLSMFVVIEQKRVPKDDEGFYDNPSQQRPA